MHKIRIPQIWSVGLLLIFILNISILPQSHSVLESDLQNQEGTLDPLQDENQRYQYDTSNHQFMPGKVMSPWTPPSLSGTGSELPVTEFADIIEADQQITLTYDSGTSSYSTDTASLVLPSPWEGTRHYTFVDNIDEDRVWVNNTDFSTTVDPWTGGDYDAPSYTNTFVEERVINPPGQSGNPAIHLRMNAAGNTRFDAGDACWFEEAVNITRGTAVYAWLELDYYAADGAGGTGEAPWGHTQLYIQIEGIDVWVTAFDDIPLEQTWYHLPPTSIDPSVFNTPNSQVDIRIGIRSVLTMSYTTVNYNEAYFDDVEIHLKAFARPSDLGLTMNGYTVEDGNITHPDGYTLTVGSYSSGAVSDLQDSDNSDLVINSSSNQIDLYTYYDLDTDGITEAEVTILELWIEAAFSTDITDGNLLVYDFSAGAWEKIHDGYTPNVVDEDWSWITTDPAQYIHDTEHYIRFRINGTHSSSFSLGIDYVHFAMTTNTANAAFGVGMYVQDKGTPWTSVDSPIAADFTFNYGASPPDLDVTVTLDCDQRFYAYRNTPDTLYEMNTGSLGTTYRVDNGTDVTWDFYVYISVPSGYTATEFTISSIPTDWSIGWVSEPQTPTVNNVGKTYLSAGVLTVPILPISPAPDGYWHIKATSPNYAQSLETQIEDPPSVWSPATTFRPTNTTRARGTILTSIPSPVNVTWFTPAGIEFYETHPPGAYTLTTGTSISGTVADLQSSDDADLVIESVGNVIDLYTSYDLDADGIAEADVTNLELWIEAAYNTSITDGDLYVRDFTGGTWEKINENYTPTTDQAWSWTTVNPGAYIDDTSHEIWFRVNGTHSGAFSIGIDYMHFQLTYLNYSGLSGVSGVVTTPSFTFPTSKTTAGEWTVLMKWINGTEVAYIAEPFKLNHPSELHSLNSPISAALGDTVTAWVRFNDSDNSQNILTGSVSTSGDGEFPAISFNPNSQFNRWEASFFVDTGFSVGTHTLPISGSAPYYNNPVSINFVIEVSDPSTTLTITKPMGGQTSIDPTQTLTFYLFYKDGGQGIPGLTQNNWTIDIQPGNPSSNLVIPNPTEVVGDPGNYTTTTQVGVDVDTYSITFTANGTHLGYAVASTFFVLSVVPVLTNFIVSSPGQTYQAKVNIWVNLTLHYETGGGVPIQGADVSEELGTPPELTVQLLSTQTNSSGDFNASVRASAPGAFSVTFKANKTAYADGFTYFTLATGAQPAHLVITNPGSPTQATIGVGQSFTLNMTYETTPAPGTGLPNADWNITVDPNIGGWTPPNPTDEGGGDYSVVLAPPTTGTYTIVFTANYSGYTDGVTFFTLLMGDIPAILTANPESTGILAGDTATFTLWYKNGTTGIPGANIARSISPSGPTLNVVDNSEGKYTASGSFGDPNTYTIRFTASKTNYTDGRVTAVLNVALRPTKLEITSPSAAEIIAEETYPLKVKYTSSGSGVGGASISILVTPTTGMTYEPGVDLGSGIYQIVLHGDSIGTYTVTVTLSHYPHRRASVNFFLTVKPIPTTLNILELQGTNLTTSLAQPIDETFQVMLNYARDENASRPVDNATLNLLGIEEWQMVDYLGNGTYIVEVNTGDVLGIYPILVMASKSNYEVGRASFELQVRPYTTELLLWEREETSATVPVGETLELEVYYNNTDRGAPISDAELVVSGLPLTNNRTITWEQVGDIYRASIGTGILPETKPFTLTITGRHPPQYDPASMTFELTIIPIPFRAQNQPPAVPGAEPTLAQSISVVEDKNANVTIQLWDTYHNVPIEDAEVIWTLYVPETEKQGTAKAAAGKPTISFMTAQSPDGERASGEFEYIGNGTYVAFVPAKGLDPDTYRLEVIANKELYGEQTFTMDYVVTPKPGTPTTYFLGLASIIVGSIGGFYSWYFYFRWPPQVRYIRKALKRVEAGSQVEEGRFPSKDEHRQAITEEQLRLPRQLME